MVSQKIIANRFKINNPKKDLISHGAMGAVFRGVDIQTRKQVAIKVLNPTIVINSPDFVDRFKRECEILQQLNHPNIVKMLAAVEERGYHFLIMEYVSGGSLQMLIARQQLLPVKRVAEMALDLSDALGRAHRLNIVHRDIKPANVLLAEDKTPRLADFGVALVEDSQQLTQSGTLFGTVSYLSPEACNGEKLDTRSDIWAFGVLLFELLTGQRPFHGETPAAIMAAILIQPTPDITALRINTPETLVDLIDRILEKDPEKRIPSIRMVGGELEAILKGWQPTGRTGPLSVNSIESNRIICPKCQNINSDFHQRCSRCGIKLQADCPYCYKLNKIAATYCRHCAADLGMWKMRRRLWESEKRQQDKKKEKLHIQKLIQDLAELENHPIAINGLYLYQSDAVDQLIIALKHGNDPIQLGAATVLGLIGDPQAIDPLIDCLNDPKLEAEVRRCVIVSLGQLQAESAIESLGTQLRDRDKTIRDLAEEALWRIGGSKAQRILREKQ